MTLMPPFACRASPPSYLIARSNGPRPSADRDTRGPPVRQNQAPRGAVHPDPFPPPINTQLTVAPPSRRRLLPTSHPSAARWQRVGGDEGHTILTALTSRSRGRPRLPRPTPKKMLDWLGNTKPDNTYIPRGPAGQRSGIRPSAAPRRRPTESPLGGRTSSGSWPARATGRFGRYLMGSSDWDKLLPAVRFLASGPSRAAGHAPGAVLGLAVEALPRHAGPQYAVWSYITGGSSPTWRRLGWHRLFLVFACTTARSRTAGPTRAPSPMGTRHAVLRCA